MKYDRYNKNPILYLIGTLLYLFALACFALGFYLVPYFFLKIRYNIPEFIVNMYNIIKNDFNLADNYLKAYIICGLFILSILSSILAKLITKKLDPIE
jgi:hypothetical protein